jgi:hypothetical protein
MQRVGECGAEEQRLSLSRHHCKDGLQLCAVLASKQSVSLVQYEILDLRKQTGDIVAPGFEVIYVGTVYSWYAHSCAHPPVVRVWRLLCVVVVPTPFLAVPCHGRRK